MRGSPVTGATDRSTALVAAPPGQWGKAAACAAPGLDPVVAEVFTTDGWTPWDTAAVAVCRGCPVRAACTAYAASIAPVSGIWGGWRRVEHLPVRPSGTPVSAAAAGIGD